MSRATAPRRLARLLLPAAICGGTATPAAAQLLQDAPTVMTPAEAPIATARSAFARDADVAVADRMLPEFAAQGVSVGAFDVYPGLAIGPLVSSNVFADEANERSDAALVIRPEVTVRTSAGPYRFGAFVRGDVRRYADLTSENTEELLTGVEGGVAIGALSSLSAGVGYGSLITPRFAPDSLVDAAKPIEFDTLMGFAGGTIEGSDTRLVFRADIERLRFRDTPARDGGTLFTRDRDRTRVGGLVRLERAISPALSVYAAGTANRIDFRLPSGALSDRDSTGYGAYLGSSFEATRLLRGDVRVGYIRQDFDLDGVRPISGLGANGTLVYFPSRLLTVTARADSVIEDSGVPGSAGVFRRGGSVRGDLELRRYLIASAEAGYFRETYRGLARRDDLPFADLSATYLSFNHWNARVGYRYLARDTTAAVGVRDFDDHRLSATLTFQR